MMFLALGVSPGDALRAVHQVDSLPSPEYSLPLEFASLTVQDNI